MTKISFDVDFNQDPEKILKEIQKRAEAEVAKRESKEKESAYLSNLHEVVNKEIGTDYKNINALIRALTKYATPSVRDKILTTSPSGRRKTISMNKEIYDQIQSLLSKPNPNKAAIARETGASVVQVRKVAEGGFDKKYGGLTTSGKAPPIPKPAPVKEDDSPASLPPIADEPNSLESPSLPPPSFGADDEAVPDLPASLPPTAEIADAPEDVELSEDESTLPSPTFGDSVPPLPESSSDQPNELPSISPPDNEASLDLPPPSFGDDLPSPSEPESITEEPTDLPPRPAPLDQVPADLPPPPSFGDEPPQPAEPESITEEPTDLPPPPAPLDQVPADLPPPPSFGDEPPQPAEPESITEEPTDLPLPSPIDEEISVPPPPVEEQSVDIPPPPPPVDEPAPPAPPLPDSAPVPPTIETPALSRPPKPSLSSKPGKPSLSLKKGKSKTKGLKLTRPPLKKRLPPPS